MKKKTFERVVAQIIEKQNYKRNCYKIAFFWEKKKGIYKTSFYLCRSSFDHLIFVTEDLDEKGIEKSIEKKLKKYSRWLKDLQDD